jgi:hypothetical protein
LGKTNLTESVNYDNTVKVEINIPAFVGKFIATNNELRANDSGGPIQNVIIRSFKIVDGVKIPVIETNDTLNASNGSTSGSIYGFSY